MRAPPAAVGCMHAMEGATPTLRARHCGMTLSWEEGVPQWILGRCFAHERNFASGLLGRVVTEIDMCPAGGGGSQVRYRLSIAPRRWIAAVLLRLGFLPGIGRIIDRLFRQAADVTRRSIEETAAAIMKSLSRDVDRWWAEARGHRADAQRQYTPSKAQRIDVEKLYRDARRRLPATMDGTQPLPVPDTCPVTLAELLSEPDNWPRG